MRLHRFYIDKDLKVGSDITVDETSYLHQWMNVFRFTSGDRIILFNGNGSEFETEFLEIHKKKAVLKILSEKESIMPNKTGKEIHLYMAMIKKDLFELVVEKCTEIGVSSITPIITERTQNKNLNMDRLQKIAVEASEQSGRGDVPRINTAVSLQNALDSANGYTIFIGDLNHTSDQEKIKKSSNNSKDTFALFIGPEGGWGEEDYQVYKDFEINLISLGETILRAETAAIVGSFILLK